ncbi:Putative odorant receptor 13a [Melipona quadrifasciata]|uniref:Putative odorant receptor 13a n=1 Tax=Melipona quadrifasciata TaxID=166423 RepID=A0A0M8ZYA0_9HYME|nr:Putative odorant receptor 13a [Melipona quadrifasciata]
MGIWPEERRWNRPSSYLVLGPFLTMFCFAWCPQTINLAFIIKDMDLVVENLSMGNMSVTISIVKTVCIWLNGKHLNYQYGWNRYIMKYMGIWPKERKWNQLSSYVVLLPSLMMLCFVCAPQTANLPFIVHDLNLMVENLAMAMTSLLKCVAKDWATVETRTGRETMTNVARISRKTTIGCLMLCQLVVTSYMFLRLSTLKQSDNKLVYRSYFPYNASVSPNYELTMIAQVIGGLCGALTYISVDTFIVMLVLHACGQFSNLKDELGNIHSCDRKDLQAKLKKIVEKHNYIVEYVLKLNCEQKCTESFEKSRKMLEMCKRCKNVDSNENSR